MKAITVLISACISFSVLTGCIATDPYYARPVYIRPASTSIYYHPYQTRYYYDDDYYSPAYYPYYYPATVSVGYYGGYGYRHGYRGYRGYHGYHHY